MTEERRTGGDRREPTVQVGDADLGARRSGARVFVHPRCASGPAFGALVAGLEKQGFDFNKVRLFAAYHNRHELVLEILQEGAVSTFERMDGERFKHRMGATAPEPEMA